MQQKLNNTQQFGYISRKGGFHLRTNLKVFRIKQNLTQSEMSEKIGCVRETYQAIESGAREGRQIFWSDLQKAFDIPDSEMWALKKNE